MQDLSLIRYKWEHGVYNIEQMIQLVNKGIISKKQFFRITRFHYDAVNNFGQNLIK